jgi:butyrate kinase
MNQENCVFVINPGSTSTKLAFLNEKGEILWEHSAKHEGEPHTKLKDMAAPRAAQIDRLIKESASAFKPRAVVGRGGPLRPLEGGAYVVNDKMIGELLMEKWSAHISNLGAPLARHFAEQWRVPSYVVDPVTVDNFSDLARISGVPEITRKCRSHALNIRSCSYLAAAALGKSIADSRFVVAHLGGGISIAAVIGGRIVDVNDALLGMGPFSPERAGAVPLEGLIDLQASEKYSVTDLKKYLSKGSGLKGYLGTNDMREVESRMEAGDEKAKLIFRAMIYQIAKEIGACSAALQGHLDAIVLTGGLTNSRKVTAELEPYIKWIGKIQIYLGEREMEALAAGAFRVLNGIEAAKEY